MNKILFMIYKIFICGAILSSAPVLAGHPDQDETLRQVRSQVKQGAPPSQEDLLFGAKWKCLNFLGVRDNYYQWYSVISFSRFDGLIITRFWETDGNSELPDEKQLLKSMAFTGQGLVGHTKSGIVFMVRVANSGDLVIENASSNWTIDDYGLASSIYDNKKGAWAYGICSKDHVLPDEIN